MPVQARPVRPGRITRARVLWIEANPVSGGSHSQVQFPSELHRFFRLPSNARIGDTRHIGVLAGGVRFPAKKMDFHHNGMWRLNLPTSRQGLGGYRGNLVVFERTDAANLYRLWIVAPAGPLAKKLYREARANRGLGSTTREDGRPRRYGVFT
jgi:hypothetical protein